MFTNFRLQIEPCALNIRWASELVPITVIWPRLRDDPGREIETGEPL